MKIKISIVYVHFNTPDEIANSIQSLLTTQRGIEYEIIIVDNNSQRKVPRKILSNKKIKIIHNRINVGFGGGCNIGSRIATGEYLLFLNTDTKVFPGFLKNMLETFKEKKVGIVGPLMHDLNENILPTISSFVTFPQVIVIYSILNKIFKNNRVSKKFWLFGSKA